MVIHNDLMTIYIEYFAFNIAPVFVTVTPNTVAYSNATTVTVNCTATGRPIPMVSFLNVTCLEPIGEAEEIGQL